MKTITFSLLLILAALLSMPLSAAPYQQSDRQYERQEDHRFDNREFKRSSRQFNDSARRHINRQQISRQQAADIAQREHPGRVLGVKRKEKTYRVRTLNRRGELRETRVNARDGKVIKRRR